MLCRPFVVNLVYIFRLSISSNARSLKFRKIRHIPYHVTMGIFPTPTESELNSPLFINGERFDKLRIIEFRPGRNVWITQWRSWNIREQEF